MQASIVSLIESPSTLFNNILIFLFYHWHWIWEHLIKLKPNKLYQKHYFLEQLDTKAYIVVWKNYCRANVGRILVHLTSGLIVVYIDSLKLEITVTVVGTSWVDTVLIRDYFPELQTNKESQFTDSGLLNSGNGIGLVYSCHFQSIQPCPFKFQQLQTSQAFL